MLALLLSLLIGQTFDVFGTAEFDLFGELAQVEWTLPDSRPLILVYTVPGCFPCRCLKQAIEAGELDEFRFEFRSDPPEWVTAVPLLHYETREGWKQFRAYQFRTRQIPAEFRKVWRSRR